VPFSSLIPILEVLFSDSKEPEVLWNFSHYEPGEKRRLTLAQNPHFYDQELPPRGNAHRDTFSTLPIELFQGQIYVYKKSDRRVFLECCPLPWALDNVWIVNRILIFRGPCPASHLLPQLTLFPDISGKVVRETEVGHHHPHALSCSRVIPDANGGPERLEEVCQTNDWRQTIHNLWNTHPFIHFGLISP